MSERTIEIKPAERSSAKAVIGLVATSGEGKTYSALLLALGLAGGNPAKVGLLDTENRRGSLYSDIFGSAPKDRFLIGDLTPPFSPSRYIAAMRQFAEAGIEALVIDSASHEHEGEGGLEEIAHRPKANGGERKIADWITAKREHKRFMNTLLFLPCHVIVCFRAREKMDFRDPAKPISLGLQPVTEKNVLFEMTASFLLSEKGKRHDEIKLPECLRGILGKQGYFTEQHGADLREWLGGGGDKLERARNSLALAASEGTGRFKEVWIGLDNSTKTALAEFKDTLKALALHADEDKKSIIGNDGDNGAPD